MYRCLDIEVNLHYIVTDTNYRFVNMPSLKLQEKQQLGNFNAKFQVNQSNGLSDNTISGIILNTRLIPIQTMSIFCKVLASKVHV